MLFSVTTATHKVMELTQRIRALQGGTSAGKTICTLQVLIDLAQKDETPTVTSIVSESLPHLKKGAMRDFLNIMQGHGYFMESNWNRTDFIYTFPPGKGNTTGSGSIIEFFGADQPLKVRGPRRDRLFCNEVNNLAFETFEQLEVRTRETIWMDWNPSVEFWFYTEMLGKRDDIDHLIITYLDNEALDASIVASIEQRKNRPGWWQVFGLGQLGEVDGKIYTGWGVVDEVPHEAKLVRYGLDFGYSNDPTAIIAIYQYNGGYILDEVLHQKGMLNSQIAAVIQNQENTVLVVADSAEPKSIDEIGTYGIPIIGCTKGKDSVKQGISVVQDQQISMTRRSLNLIKSYRNYLWEVDKNGRVLNVPEHAFSDAMDAVRYGIGSLPKLVVPLTKEQRRTRTFQRAMSRKHEREGGMRRKGKRFLARRDGG